MTTSQQMIRTFGVNSMGMAGLWVNHGYNTIARGGSGGCSVERWSRLLLIGHPGGHQYFYYKQY